MVILKNLLKKIRESVSFTKLIEVEVSTYEDAIKAYKAGANAILLDNMRPYEIIPIVKRKNTHRSFWRNNSR